ncbi:MAG: M20/M25/M40 family metallo-hydrolase [Candidatus Schekmanbacteria bacterium]|nr:M20/M25/M40 family metallo-hydrolase [Candidatus Schekmanbacteria bacterium]
MSDIDWKSVEEEAVALLQDLLRIDTTNPPGDEIKAVRHVAGVLARAGIACEVFEPFPGRGSLVTRVGPGGGNDLEEALLMHGHLDVVPAEPKQWRFPPFSGELADGCVWGRGAVDMKGIVAMQLMVALLVHRGAITLKRPLKLAWTADEEEGGGCGMAWIAANRPDVLHARYAIGEVGGFSMALPGGRRAYPIGVAEKGLAWVKVTVSGEPGHGSMPQLHARQNAVARLAAGVDRLQRRGLEYRLTPVVRQFLDEMAAVQPRPSGWVLGLLKHRRLARAVLRHVIPDPGRARALHAALHDTATPTVLNAGVGGNPETGRGKPNLIPSTASVVLDGRTLPGTTTDSFLRQLRRVFGDDAEYEVIHSAQPTSAPTTTRLYDLMVATLQAEDEAAVPLPNLVVGFTDAKHIAQLGVDCYGFAPMKLPDDLNFARMFHGHDERLPVSSLMFGIRALLRLVQRALGE